MQLKVQLQPAFVLHARPYRETSLLVDLLTPEYGVVRVVARGAAKSKSIRRANLQPFVALLVSWSGRSELKTLNGVDTTASAFGLVGRALFSGLYINELLVRLLKGQDHCQTLFDEYCLSLQGLVQCQKAVTGQLESRRLESQQLEAQQLETVLRQFELNLLEFLGYAVPFPSAVMTPQSLTRRQQGPDSQDDEQQGMDNRGVDAYYLYSSQTGFDLLPGSPGRDIALQSFSAKTLAAIAQGDYSDGLTLTAAKRLTRLALAPLLGDRPLRSRELFVQKLKQPKKQG